MRSLEIHQRPVFTYLLYGGLAVLWLLMQCVLWSIHGVTVAFDSLRYIKQANLLAAGDFASLKISYIVYTGLLSLSIWLGSLKWIVLLQIAVSGLAAIAMCKAAYHLSHSRLVAALTTFMLVAWPDFQFWNLYIHTESLFVSVTIIVFWRVISASKQKHYLQLLPLLLVVLLLRPNGFMVVLAMLVYFGIAWCRKRQYSLWKATTLVFVLAVGAMVLVSQLFLKDISSDFAFTNYLMSGGIIQGYGPLWVDNESTIQLKGSPLEQAVDFVLQEPGYFLKKSSLRLLYYWAQLRPYYSLKHNLAVAFLMYPVYFLGLVAIVQKRVPVPVLGFILALALQLSAMVVVSAVDWDNRFILPLLPFLFLLGATGFHAVLEKLLPRSESKKY